jgi:hypothetical protein
MTCLELHLLLQLQVNHAKLVSLLGAVAPGPLMAALKEPLEKWAEVGLRGTYEVHHEGYARRCAFSVATMSELCHLVCHGQYAI